MDQSMKVPPSYAIASVDHALRIATMLQLEGSFSVTEVAGRLGVAPSTAHRLMQMLVYRDFAVQGNDRRYHAGPLLELARYSPSRVSALRTLALPHMQRLVDDVDESSNLAIRTDDTIRFVASVQCQQALRVGTREGMVFPAHRTTAGLLLLATLTNDELGVLYAEERYEGRLAERPDLRRLKTVLTKVRKAGFSLNLGMSERGIVAVGVPIEAPGEGPIAGLSVSLPSVRYDKNRLDELLRSLHATAAGIERDLALRP
jgi:DNA-binding IclR family transcriptional regulator